MACLNGSTNLYVTIPWKLLCASPYINLHLCLLSHATLCSNFRFCTAPGEFLCIVESVTTVYKPLD